jgi:hypothetical protein
LRYLFTHGSVRITRFLSEFYAILGDSVLFDIIVAGATEAISLPRLHGLFQQ